MTQANDLFNAWPNSTVLVTDMTKYLRPGAHYLVEVDEVPIYYLGGTPTPSPASSPRRTTSGTSDKQGSLPDRQRRYVAAIKAGYFQVIAYNDQTTPAADNIIARPW